MDHPVFIAVLAGLIVAAVLVAMREAGKRRPPKSRLLEEEDGQH